jgi:hypothetical protein
MLLGNSYGPQCRCSKRGTVRVGYSEEPSLNADTTALLRRCDHCNETYLYRLHDGHLVPMTPLTALALDEQRATGRAA